jgi:8-oxo-dGTP pyrophosphatase MutT (NUDIX family)
MKNPWTRINSRVVYENPWIKVEEDQVLNPSGGNGIYGKVLFKNKAIGIIPLDEQLNTWIIGQFRYTLNEYSWEIPMGGGHAVLSSLDGAKRELKEETGLSANSWTEILKIHTSNSVTDEVGYVFIAEDLSQGETSFDETEELVVKKIPFQKAVDMVMAGEITDAISIAGILKAEKILVKEGRLTR